MSRHYRICNLWHIRLHCLPLDKNDVLRRRHLGKSDQANQHQHGGDRHSSPQSFEKHERPPDAQVLPFAHDRMHTSFLRRWSFLAVSGILLR